MLRDHFFCRFNARRQRAQRSNFHASKLPREPRRRLGLPICGPEPLEDRRLLTFAPPVTIPLAAVPQSLALGDFYGDGKVDMAVAEGNVAPSQIEIFHGDGDGTFQPPVVAYNFGSEGQVVSLGAADLNHDGKLDLVALVNSDTVDVFLGNGNGTFQPPVTYDVSGASSMALGDVLGNGQTDVVLAGGDAKDHYAVQVLLADQDGTLQAPITSTFGEFTTPQNYLFDPTSLAVGDLNGDGKLDVIAASYADQRVLVSLGNGDGTFKSPVSYTTDPIPREAMRQPIGYLGVSAIAVGDFAHNGKLDIAATNIAAQTVSVLLGNGDGTFQPSVNYSIGSQANDMVAGDFNGDGDLDLAFSSRVDNALYVIAGNGDGSFQHPVKAASVNGPMLMAAADFNNDGLSDLAVTSVVYNFGGFPTSYGVSTILSLRGAPPENSFTTPDEAFVTQLYEQLLGRPVEAAAAAYWSNYLAQGGTRLGLALAIESSAEYRTDQVASLFERYLHRAAEPAALAADSHLLAQGMTDKQLAAIIVSSDEYFALHGGTNDGFLTALFQDALNRPIETAALNWFDQYLAAGGTRAAVAAMIFGSHEYHADVVAGIYQQLLDRTPDASGQEYWAEQLDNRATDEQLIAVIAASDEYFSEQIEPVIQRPSAITSAATTTFTVGTEGTFEVTATGNPTAEISESGVLPEGVTFFVNSSGNPTLSGTPAVGTEGTYAITITASNGVGPDASQRFSLVVVNSAPAAPAITSPSTATFAVGAAGTAEVTTTGNPTAAITESGVLPEGVTFVDDGDGTATISGRPAIGTGGTYPITITASNDVAPAAIQNFSLVVVNPAPLAPAITSPSTTSFAVGTAGTFEVTTDARPTAEITETGVLPEGVTFVDDGDGTATLSGKPAAGTEGTYQIAINASNGVAPDATQSFSLVVQPG